MVGFVIAEYLVFALMVGGSFLLGHLGLLLVERIDSHLSAATRRPNPGSPEGATRSGS